MALSKRRQQQKLVAELAQGIFGVEKPTKLQLFQSTVVLKAKTWMEDQGLTKALIPISKFVRITDDSFSPRSKQEIRARFNSIKSLFPQLVTASAKFPDTMPLGLVPVNHLAKTDDIISNPTLLQDPDEAEKYFHQAYESIYLSASPNGELLAAYIRVQQRKARGLEEQAVIRTTGWSAKGLLPSGIFFPQLPSSK
jgi:hypothetical protein